MAGRGSSNRPGGPGPSGPPAAQRQNEYFVPRDGIDREVITSDICRYLGNDALVRPGTYESPDGRVTQGYFITAYRNLTSAMIQDLKADSARWEQERRAAARSSGGGGGAGGTMHSGHSNGVYVRSSNSPVGSREQQTRGQPDYSTWKNRQREQDFEAASYGHGQAMDIDYPPAAAPPPKNPGYGGPSYAGVPPQPYAQAPYPPQVHPGPSQYQAQYGYAPGPPPTQYSPGPQGGDNRYSGMAPPPPIAGAFGQDAPPFVHGGNFPIATPSGYAAGPGAQQRMQQPMPPMPSMPLTSASAPPTSRVFSAPVAGAPVYGSEADPYGYPPAPGNPATQAFPSDPLYGRGAYATTATTTFTEASSDDLGSPAGTTQRQGFGAPEPPFEDHASSGLPTTTSASGSTPAPAIAGPSSGRRDRDSEPRERERDHRNRDRDRDERHGDRNNRHRHR
ncbi:hypothetical protein QBC35DRAFT_450699 [Podospora australis]|uniref:Transcription factor n=1 Tax=Podospora australis TaxID=1536484 RepID=A0AAN6WVK2_9PEZI|nr:hypothetical protein QBC35DRAFT_450699 [Podospora australis]